MADAIHTRTPSFQFQEKHSFVRHATVILKFELISEVVFHVTLIHLQENPCNTRLFIIES